MITYCENASFLVKFALVPSALIPMYIIIKRNQPIFPLRSNKEDQRWITVPLIKAGWLPALISQRLKAKE